MGNPALTLIGRIETVRMNILPRLLFLFQSLPIRVHNYVFKTLDKIISKFFWQNKKPRIKYTVLLSSKEKGGLNLPNLKKYYWAAQLRAITRWMIKDAESIWVGIEQNSFPGLPLGALPFLSEKNQRGLKITNECMRETLKIWSIVRKKLRLSNSTSKATKIAVNPDFVPSTMDPGYDRWARKGLVHIAQVFTGPNMKSFEELRKEFNLPAHDFYIYLQLRSYLQNHKEWDNISRTPSEIENIFMSLTENKTKKGVISRIYKALQHESEDNNMRVKEKNGN